jgi:glutamate formiminotransferase / formiminotetrahydrofolate cyclodeaminase
VSQHNHEYNRLIIVLSEVDMAKKIVECVANYSEARRPEIIDAIAEALTSIAGVHILDKHSDNDHNRTVLTFVGPPEAIEEAAFLSIAKAAELIDLDQHTGEHPRLGATDVVPFVPIEGVSMEDCVEIAKRLGKRVGQELGIPVYLYEQAALRPERQNLENIRRGQYEGLKKEIGVNPDRDPDFGPAEVGPAGATVIGARPPLIAFNVYLTTDDVSIAKKIAKTVRHSSGGLRYVKGLGLTVEGRAQVSMNLTNFRGTSVATVVELIRREAQRYGVGIHHTELVGLIPEEALRDAAVWYMQLDQFEPNQVLERRLYQAQEQVEKAPDDDKFSEDYAFLDALAAGTPTPGGGSAAAYTAASAAALVAMVARLTLGKKKYENVEERMHSILEASETLRKELALSVQRDAAAYESVMKAYRLPKESLDEKEARRKAIEAAVLQAAKEPLQVARHSVGVLELAEQAAKYGNVNAITDVGTGAALAIAALKGAGFNVRINLSSLEDENVSRVLMEDLKNLESHAAKLEGEMRGTLQERGGLSLE